MTSKRRTIPAEAFETTVLSGSRVRLVPLAVEHEAGLREAVGDGELWRLWYTTAPEPDGVRADIERRLRLRDAGEMIPFAVFEAETGRLLGMTTFMSVDAATPRVEIGYTWLRASVQRTGINTEMKLLMMTYAFEELGCTAVEFRTHFLNQQSRRAIERLGAKLDGILRNHMYMKDGTLRDTCVYSVIAGEWPTVKRHLLWLGERAT